MSLGGVIRAIERRVARFNRWLAPAAVASNTLPSDPGKTVDAGNVVAILGEIEQDTSDRTPSGDETGSR